MSNTLAAHSYVVSGYSGFTLTEALQLWKTKYQDDIRDFYKEVCNHPIMDELKDFVTENWDSIEPVNVQQAFLQENIEKRRAFFDAIGIVRLVKELNPTLLDKQTITKKRFGWDDDNKEVEKVFEDTYELYMIDKDVLYKGIKDSWFAGNDHAYVVRCWCTTTNREYWIFTRNLTNTYRINPKTGGYEQPPHDAIASIAWTIRINVKDPERIYRQGDIIVVKHGPKSQEVFPYHLEKEQYLELMYSET